MKCGLSQTTLRVAFGAQFFPRWGQMTQGAQWGVLWTHGLDP